MSCIVDHTWNQCFMASSSFFTINLCNGLSHIRRKAITWTDVKLLSSGPKLQCNWNKISNLSFNKMQLHYSNVTMGVVASEITDLTIVYSTVYSGADKKKHQSSASLAFVRGIHRRMFPFDGECHLQIFFSSLISLSCARYSTLTNTLHFISH